ncbi:MAG: hypothetical protein QM760_15970 [Nibricoccus sp.]
MIASIETAPAAEATAVPKFGKQRPQLLAIFERQRRNSLIWFLIAAASWIWAAWDRRQLVEKLMHKREIVMIDSLGTYYVSPVVDIHQAKDLHAMQTKLACKAIFERNPQGLDNPELFKQLFLRDAAQVAQTALNKTKAEFEAKSLHQKVEMAPPEILSTRDNAFYTSTDIQLIRVGSYKGEAITEVLRYRVKFKFLVNPDLTRNGRFPTAVAAFQVEPLKT